jgi:hypothetical protein
MLQSCRAMTECIFGWGKTARYNAPGIAAVAADFLLNLIAYNLIRTAVASILEDRMCAVCGGSAS